MSGPVSYLDRIFTELTTILLIPFRSLPPLAGLLWLSVLAGVCMILVFGRLTDQEAIAETRRRMGGQVLGMMIYIGSPRTVLSMAGRLVRSNFRYLLLILKPLLVIAVPFAVLMGQLDARYGTAPLTPGEDVTVTLGWDGTMPSRGELGLEVSNADVVDPPVYVPPLGEISFRIRPAGTGPVVMEAGGESIPLGPVDAWSGALSAREFDAGTPFTRLLRPWNVRPVVFDTRQPSPDRGRVFLDPLRFAFLGGRWSWLAVLLVVSSLSALAGALVLRIRV
jgi:hypothetical protein